MSSHESDRNLLFGVFAMQVHFITQETLIAALQAWVKDKHKSLGQVLLEQGQLNASQVNVIESVLAEHLKAHGGDAERSLRALADASPAFSTVESFGDAELDSSIQHWTAGRNGEATQKFIPATVAAGRYKRGEFHREGGLGQVYFAEDTELHREVALKEIKPKHADEPESQARFVLEAEITGGLEHPGVVPVYGLGRYADGRPYYAMRFIRGDNLREAVQRFHQADQKPRARGERHLAFCQLLRRFINVCNTIAYAHTRGVLHRDLKPANVMLGKYGETLVVDWGLAKTGVQPRRDDSSESVAPTLKPSSGSDAYATQRGVALGTIPYMSPEQAAGRVDLMGPSSDIYSLGSTLYAVLTGVAPYEGKSDEEKLEHVKRGEFVPALQRKPGTPPALDAICRKAMALAPGERYQTALELADDVEHWLADEPVSAYPEPISVRLGRVARRHKAALVGAAVFLVSATVLSSIGTGLIWAAERETEAQRVVAVENLRLAREKLFDSVEMIQTADIDFASKSELHARRKEILLGAAKLCNGSLQREPDDQEMQKRAAIVYRYLGNVHRTSDEVDAAEPLYAESVRLYGVLAEQLPNEAIYREKWVETLRDQAVFLVKLGQLRQAKENLVRAGKMAAEMREADPKRAQLQQNEASALRSLANIAHSVGEDADAMKRTREAVEILKKLVEMPANKRHPYDPLLYATALTQLAVLQRADGDLKVARATHSAAMAVMKDVSDKQPGRIAPGDIANVKAACALEQCRTLAKADAKARKAAETNLGLNAQQWQAIAKTYPWIPYYRDRQAVALQLRGTLRLEDQQLDAAKKDLEDSQAILEKLVADHPRVVGYHADLGRTYAGLARLAGAQAQRDAADGWTGKARNAFTKAAELSPDDALIRKDAKELPN